MSIRPDADGNNAYLADQPDKKFQLQLGFGGNNGYVDPGSPGDPLTAPGTALAQSVLIQFDTNGNVISQPTGTGTDATRSSTLKLHVFPPLNTPAGTPPVLPAQMLPNARFGRQLANDAEGLPVFNNEILINIAAMRQERGISNISGLYRDGMEPGTLDSISIGEDGIITGVYTNGKTMQLAQIAITTFKNPAGLQKVGSSLFRQTNNSGFFDGVGMEPTNLRSGSLEMSNVDLSQEFTEMITTQRGFQANSRVITVSDDMLQELVNLKR